MDMKFSKRRLIAKTLLLFVAFILLGFVSPLRLTKYDLKYSNLPEAFNGYKILQITDFHCKEFGDKEKPLIKMAKRVDPDIIVLTGDIVDEAHSIENAEYLLAGLTEIAPVYYVTGNHEYREGAPFTEFLDLCVDYGVTYLKNDTVEIEKDGEKILLTGLDFKESTHNMRDVLGYADNNFFNILLYHDSTKFNFLSEYGYDLIISGHGHGGLIRIPFLGGLIGTDGNFFPTYDYGYFQEKDSVMISSSGLGDARIPRWNNPRECVQIKLHRAEK